MDDGLLRSYLVVYSSAGHQLFNVAPLLNQVSEKRCEIWNEVSENFPEISEIFKHTPFANSYLPITYCSD